MLMLIRGPEAFVLHEYPLLNSSGDMTDSVVGTKNLHVKKIKSLHKLPLPGLPCWLKL